MESLDRSGYDEDTYEVYSKYRELPANCLELETGLDPGAVVDLSIDLLATDEQIVESLKFYLAAARKLYEYPEGGKITAAITKKLVQNCVLPYLDLKAWAMLENKHIPQHIIGDWLFSKDLLNVADKVRNTVEPFADRAITQGFIETLANM
jgi:hypothetical protein